VGSRIHSAVPHLKFSILA